MPERQPTTERFEPNPNTFTAPSSLPLIGIGHGHVLECICPNAGGFLRGGHSVRGPSPDFDPDGELEGYTSYLAYANFTNPSDVLGSIYADTAVFTDAAPLQINAPCGCWNPDEASMVIGPSINPAFDPFFPRLKYDSFWTIGKLYETDEGQTPSWTSSPVITGENFCDALVYNGLAYVTGTTGSWPVNAIAGDDLKILIARITSCGEVSLTMNAQVFIEGDQGSVQQFQMCETADLDLDGICDDVDDCVGLYDACGVCNGPGPVEDCGCDDIPAGFCDCEGNQIDAIGICGGTCPADADNDGICDDVDDCVGAYDAIGVCNGNCEEDLNGNGICDDVDFPGCTDGLACNFDPTATFDDESCEYCDCVQPGDYALVVETSPALTLPNHTRYRFYLELANPTDRLREMGGNDEYPLSIDVPMGAYNSTANPVASPSFAPPLYCAFPKSPTTRTSPLACPRGRFTRTRLVQVLKILKFKVRGSLGPLLRFSPTMDPHRSI